MKIELVNSFAELFCFRNTGVNLAISAINVFFLFILSYKYFQVLQQGGYTGDGYVQWLKRRDNVYQMRLLILVTLSLFAFFAVTVSLLVWKNVVSTYVGLLPYVVFVFIYSAKDMSISKKVPLRITRRLIRQLIIYVILLLVMSFAILTLADMVCYLFRTSYVAKMRKVFICLMPLLVPRVVLLSLYIAQPLENKINKKYIEKCKEKLSEYKHLIRIGITGSYGKTSTKEILTTILSTKYKVLASPKSYNTPLGICKTVKYLDDGYDVFIAEMGARRQGEIKQLVDIVKPNYGIINGITNQHIETFGSIERIQKTKYELVENMSSGTVAFTCDNDLTYELYQKCPLDKICAGVDTAKTPTVYADEIEYTKNGSTFTLHIGEEKIECNTSLLGRGNLSNICLASAIAYKMGLTKEEICQGINAVATVPHRLELLSSINGMTVIDDSYNSNVQGTVIALETIGLFSGRKIVITPGLVELGWRQDRENYEYGKRLAKAVDYAILVGKSAYSIREGLLDGGFDCDKIIMAKETSDAVKKLQPISEEGGVVLFENDLPDKFA